MAYQGISTGTTPNDNTGDSLFSGALKINSNFKELYNALGNGSTLTFNKNVTLTAGDGLTGGGDLSANRTFAVDSSVARTSITITAGDGLTGGGNLSANRSFAVDSSVARTSTSINTNSGSGLTGGGNLSASRNLAVDTTVLRTSGGQTINGNLTVTGTLTAASVASSGTAGIVPIGGIIMFSGTTAPTGWALCNGQNGTPDLRDRFIVCTGSSYNLNATGGAANVTLNVNQMPSHSHSPVYDFSNWVGTNNNDKLAGGMLSVTLATSVPGTDASYGWPSSVSPDLNWADTNSGTVISRGTISLSDAGGGQSHENRPPYYALAFIMRIA